MTNKMPSFLARYAAITILMLVAASQYLLSMIIPISPWKGGGFGMFSTIAAPHSYFIRVYSKSPGMTKLPVTIPAKLIPLERRIRYFPAPRNFERFKYALLHYKWQFKEDHLEVSDSLNGYKAVNLPGISIELWQYKFDVGSSSLYTSPIVIY